MSEIPDRTLLAFLAGALEPGRAADVEEALRASAGLRARLHLLVAARAAPAPTPSAWAVPPPGPAWGLARAGPAPAGPEAWLGDDVHTEEPFVLHLRPGDPAERRRVVALREEAGAWTVAWPTRAEELRRVDELPLGPDGARELRLPAGAAPGRQRWVVLAVPEGADVDWALPGPGRWQELIDALAVDPGLALAFTVWVTP